MTREQLVVGVRIWHVGFPARYKPSIVTAFEIDDDDSVKIKVIGDLAFKSLPDGWNLWTNISNLVLIDDAGVPQFDSAWHRSEYELSHRATVS